MTTFLVVLAVVLVAFLLFVASRPATFTVRRATTVHTAPGRVFEFLNDFHQWAVWSPWEKLDPAMNRTHGGPPSGKGATYEWSGNKKVGRGRMEIVESTPPSRLVLDLHFMAPFEARNTTIFTLTPAAGSTQLAWEMQGTNTFMGKLMSVFVNMDRMIGRDFEAGLANLKAAAEGKA